MTVEMVADVVSGTRFYSADDLESVPGRYARAISMLQKQHRKATQEAREVALFLMAEEYGDPDLVSAVAEELERRGLGDPDPEPQFIRERQPFAKRDDDTPMVASALVWLAMGYRPLPLLDEPKREKIPFGRGWQNRVWTPDEIRAYYAKHPTAGLGLLLGCVGGLVDIEVDDWRKAEPTLKRIFPKFDLSREWVNGLPYGLPQTRSYTSSVDKAAGLPKIHLLFKWDPRLAGYKKSRVSENESSYYPGIEIRIGQISPTAKAQQSVIPPTNIGYQRRWVGGGKIMDLPLEVLVDLDLHHDAKKAEKRDEDDREVSAYLASCRGLDDRGRLPKMSAAVSRWFAASVSVKHVPSGSTSGTKAVAGMTKVKPGSSGWKGAAKKFKPGARVVLTKEQLTEVSLAANLAEIVSQYTGVELDTTVGGTVCCVAHNDAHPSMGVFAGLDGRWRFKCLACGVSGDSLDFVAGMEGITRPEAAGLLVAAGLQLSGSRQKPARKPAVWESPDYQALMGEAISFFESQLRNLKRAKAKLAYDYLVNERGLTDETISRLRLGLSPYNEFVKGEFNWPVGLVLPMLAKPSGFHDAGATWAGILVRTLDDTSGAKYQSVGTRGFGYPIPYVDPTLPLIVFEGELDAALAWQHVGDRATVITFGGVNNSLPRSMVRAIKYCPRIITCFDNDDPGQKMTREWAEAFRTEPVVVPRGKDYSEWVVRYKGDPVGIFNL